MGNLNNTSISSIVSGLSGFNPVMRVSGIMNDNKQDDDLIFRISFADDTFGSYLSVEDKAGHEIVLEKASISTSSARVIEAMTEVRDQSGFSLGWDGVDGRISLVRHPDIATMLLDCHNIKADGIGRLGVKDSYGVVRIALHGVVDESGVTVRYEPQIGLVYDGDFQEIQPHGLIARKVVIMKRSLVKVADMGGNFTTLPMFLSRFASDQLNQWLGLFFTYIDGVEVTIDGHPVEWSNQPVTRRPTIIFTGVDADRFLQMEVAHLLPGIDYSIQTRLQFTVVAIDGGDTHPMLYRAAPMDNTAVERDADKIGLMLKNYTPHAAAGKKIYRDGTLFIVPPEVAGPFLLHGLPSLLRDFALIGSDNLREYKIQTAFPKINVKIGSGIDFLDTQARVDVAGENISLPDLLEQYRRQRFLVLSDGNRVILDEAYMKRLERIFRVTGSGDKARVTVSFFDLPEIEALLNEPLQGDAPVRYREMLEGFNSISDIPINLSDMKATLRPYQLEGVRWMKYLNDIGMGGCLADDMGLGKTVQTIAMLTLVTSDTPSLLVMPKSLIFNWEKEIARFAPKLKTYTYYGAARDIDAARCAQVVLTTYGTLRNDIDTFRKHMWEYVVLDESQNIKNMESHTAKSVFLLQSRHRLALSGTPMENNIMELYSLFRFLNPSMLGDVRDFTRRYATPIQVDGDSDAMTALRRVIYPFMLRRLKGDVLNDLPDLTEQTVYVEMEPAHARFYEERRLHYQNVVRQAIEIDGVNKSQFVMFQALSELRRIASVPESLTDGAVISSKIDPLVESVAEAVANGHKCVVFFNFIAGIELVGERLEQLGIDYATMTGSTSDRRSVVDRFQNQASCRVLLLTLKVGGVGLNLTAADTVFIYEPWWNRAAEQQAIDRLHRMGQKTKVSAYSIIARGTIEERIRQLQEQKSALFEGIISSDTSLSKQISQDDIDFMLS